MSPKKCRIESLEGLEEVELLALRPRKNSLRCRLLGTDEEITFRTNSPSLIAPGEILTIHIHKTWTYAGHPYLSGEILHRRIDPKALDLPPLKLQDMGLWDPAENWSDLEDESGEAPDWMKELTCRGPRQAYEMESVLPGMNPEDFDSDPILEAIELADMGHPDKAEDALYRVLEADLRCLDAHAHLGNFDFEWLPAAALSHYQVGAAIGLVRMSALPTCVEQRGLTPTARRYRRCTRLSEGWAMTLPRDKTN